MQFEWDENKRTTNIARHGLDFLDAKVVFDGPRIVGAAKTVDGEGRLLTTGLLDGVYVTAIYTMRAGTVRVISMRRARDDERRSHEALHGC